MLKSNTIRFTTDTFGQAVEYIDEPIDIQPDDPDAFTWYTSAGAVLVKPDGN